jgi:flagellar motility protein MotE (MotC chaperone)
MNENEKKQPLGIFNQWYAATEAVKNAAKKPMIRGAVSRKLYSAFDDAASKIIDAQEKLTNLRLEGNFSKYEVNARLDARGAIEDLKKLQDHIKAEYKDLFGKEMKVSGAEDSEDEE